MTAWALIHGGGFDGRCWDRLLPHLAGPAVAVDLPGRGRRPMPLDQVDIAACASAVREQIDEAGFDEVVLVGHSLAGSSMPATIGLLGDRVRHAVFVACTVPEHGTSSLDTLDPEIQAMARAVIEAGGQPMVMDEEIAKLVLGDDLDAEQFAWCMDRRVPEAPGLVAEPVDLSPLRSGPPRTWVRTVGDLIVAPDKQVRFAAHVGDCPVVDIDAGHMCMVSQPESLAAILNPIAR
jgi:pimeloyl-ACP methyl ester carboxylesterase